MKLKLKKQQVKNLSLSNKHINLDMTLKIQGAGKNPTFFPCETGLCGTQMTVDYGFTCQWDCGTTIC
ncbi:hypothetical protein [Pseudoalteromonas sp. DY56-GL79]|uniref:hypothetical protein n=1 Tax=Pseudoalteromonas sp. DY56-GL79 TaxID=2967131 RepID=UPI00352A8DA7